MPHRDAHRLNGTLLLRLTVFCSGAAVLILELLGSRLLAPVFGSSLYVWSSLIAVTLLALAVGYRAGGMAADRFEPLPMLDRALGVAGWLVLLIPFPRSAMLPAAAALGLRGGALVSALLMLGPALALLGAISPLAAKAAVSGLESLGLRVGGLYALSTVGSLAGALATGFVLIPVFGVRRLLGVTAAVLFLPALAHWTSAPRGPDRRLWRALAVLGLLAALVSSLLHATYPMKAADSPWQLLFRSDSPYGEVKVAQHRQSRVLLLNGTMQTALDLTTGYPVFPYAIGVASLLRTAHPRAKRALLIGFGGGVLADYLTGRGLTVESVEIDPIIAAAARRFFVRRPGLAVAEADGRTFLARAAPGAYDAVLLDAYAGDAPPAHLLTAEAFQLVRRALAPGG
ncbi:MAG: fused MFS/spermidine synthase, partial [bacterium]